MTLFDISKLIEQDCGECIIRVAAFQPFHDEDGLMNVQVISNHSTLWAAMWRNRIKNAWSVLRGRYDWTGFEVYTAEEAHGLINAMTEVANVAFPSNPIITTESRVLKKRGGS